ncbi:hypothetical protein DMN91_009809 [Ooceraea biroi]|uniref:SOWAHA-C winged helix-turn-helix domain-containing protein n=2 Tax=Ooceraea biroi TaxID=2015173 RepID=A0A3L8DBS8_OOCBI|nr:hypothetical protein DMN91_009809 [Ooceraea biroi]
MAMPSELSLEEIRNYLLENGGTARNHDLVKHFKRFLTDPETRVEARNRFKEYVNTLATIKNEEGEKYLVLKKKYRQPSLDMSSPLQAGSPLATPDLSTPESPLREPPPYRAPPPASLSPISNNSQAIIEEATPSIFAREEQIDDNSEPGASVSSPPVPPRRKSQDKLKMENKENIDKIATGVLDVAIKEDATSTTTNPPSAEQLSVRERMQRFNRMASETDPVARTNDAATPIRRRADRGADEDDSASVTPQLDGKSREWLVRMAQGDYQALAKLAAEEPRLARLKSLCVLQMALHWAAKHGKEDIIKLIAGTYKDHIMSVNEITGYTPLHIAMQFGHENIFNLLVQVYGANQEIRDYSGKKPRQYLVSQEAAVSQDTFHKIKARKKQAEKDLGFLRIGSLNVRVKRTTEAVSQFLGVATSNTASSSNSNEKIHKSWGSADNVQLDKLMPPPKYAPIRKRRSRWPQDYGSSQDQQQVASQPTTPLLQGKVSRSKRSVQRRQTCTSSVSSSSIGSAGIQQNGDSDSDTACGFDSAWRGSAQL